MHALSVFFSVMLERNYKIL